MDKQKEIGRGHLHEIEMRILTIRGRKVLIDADLAAIYEVPTKALNQAVKRNASRFPADFAFRLTSEERGRVVTICDHLANLRFSKSLPVAYTEHGAIMVAMVLNSEKAIAMSVFVVRAFLNMREQVAVNQVIMRRFAEIDKELLEHDAALRMIWERLKPWLSPRTVPIGRSIGFRQD